MKVGDLKSRLDSEGINPYVYILGRGTSPEDWLGVYCIERTWYGWHVYCSERGDQSFHHRFLGEDKACRYFLQSILEDPDTRPPTNREGRPPRA